MKISSDLLTQLSSTRQRSLTLALLGGGLSLLSLQSAEAALVTIAGPSFTSDDVVVTSTILDFDSDSSAEFSLIFIGQGDLSGQGNPSGAAFAGVDNGGTFEVTLFDGSAGFTIDSSLTFAGTNGTSTSFATFAVETGSVGNWAGGADGYFGVVIDIAGSTHYGFGRLAYDPGTTESTANFIELVYEDVAGAPAVMVVPEPSSLLFSGVGFAAFLLRRKRVQGAA